MKIVQKVQAYPLIGVTTVCALLVGFCAQVKFFLWFTPVPITLQVFAVLLVGLVFEKKVALLALLQYVLMGIAGMPLFAGGASGLAYLLGPTGGYLLGFVVAIWTMGWMKQIIQNSILRVTLGQEFKIQNYQQVLVCLTGVAAIYICGYFWLAGWLITVTGKSLLAGLESAWYAGVVPFAGMDIIKAMTAAAIGQRIGR